MNRSQSTTPSVASTLVNATTSASSASSVSHHWSHGRRSHKLTLLRLADELVLQSVLHEAISGGSEHGQLIVLSPLTNDRRLLQADWLRLEGDPLPLSSSVAAAVLEVDGHSVSGFTSRDCVTWIARCLVWRFQQHGGSPDGSVHLVTAPLTGKPPHSIIKTKHKVQKLKSSAIINMPQTYQDWCNQ